MIICILYLMNNCLQIKNNQLGFHEIHTLILASTSCSYFERRVHSILLVRRECLFENFFTKVPIAFTDNTLPATFNEISVSSTDLLRYNDQETHSGP